MIAGVKHGEIVMKLDFAECLHHPLEAGAADRLRHRHLAGARPGHRACAGLGLLLGRNHAAGGGTDGFAEVVPDLVVEVVSPNDTRREVAAKARMWLRYDVRLVWSCCRRRAPLTCTGRVTR